ncbi:hypothetical protein K2Z84_16025 [Candidatus Binatia bacterium]|nr:hypothetical protein [Candidatus Binatia bacterium]
MKCLVTAFVLVLAAACEAGAVVPITTCDAVVPPGETGVLQNDLDCEYRCSGDRSMLCDYDAGIYCPEGSVCTIDGLILERDAVLDLNGHRVSGAYRTWAVICDAPKESPGRCVVRGPGTILADTRAIYSLGPDVFVRDVDLLGGYYAVYGTGRVVIRGSRLLPNFDNDVFGGKGVKLIDVVSDADVIDSGRDIVLRDVELRSETDRVEAVGSLRARDVVMVGSVSLSGNDVRLRRTTSQGYPGFDAEGWAGAHRRLRLVDSKVEYVVSGRPPVLVRSTCMQSSDWSSASWDVCSND